MRIQPFRAWRAAPEHAARIASPPYDVVDRESARRLCAGNPRSFLHVTRADMDLPGHIPPCDPRVYAASADAFRRFQSLGWLCRDPEPSLYAYRLRTPDHAQTGLVAVVPADGVETGMILRHEFTRPEPEEDRTRHIRALNAQTGPLLLAVPDRPALDRLLDETCAQIPLFDFRAPDGVSHTGWCVREPDEALRILEDIPVAYIADGHHRAAGAARVARERRSLASSPGSASAKDGMLAVLFPASRLRILAYNRCVRDLATLSPDGFLAQLEKDFEVERDVPPEPTSRGSLALYMAGHWYRLRAHAPPQPANNPVATLDVSLLQDRVLAPILGIGDPRRDARLDFVGGSLGPAELERRVNRGTAAAAFFLHPVDITDLMSISDAGLTLPPKSTWFEPKLRDGLFVHSLDEG